MGTLGSAISDLGQKLVSLYSAGIRSFSYAKGKILGNSIKSFWYTGTVNFGDLFNKDILDYYGFTPTWSPVEKAEVLVIGSILQIVPKYYGGHIIGSGLIDDRVHPLKEAKIWAVRGILTRDRVGAPEEIPLGDPGLIASLIFSPSREKEYTLGIVPHYVDKGDMRIKKLQQEYKKEVLIIDVNRSPASVARDITRCEAILSSSLHGLVFAESFNIPNGWMTLSNKVIGKGFKFRDYFSAIQTNREPLTIVGDEKLTSLIKHTQKASKTIVEVTVERLDNAFKAFKSRIS